MSNKPLIITMIVSLLIFLSVTFIFTVQNGYTYDQSIINYIEKISGSTIYNFMDLISLFGSSEVILLITGLIAGIFLLKRDWYHVVLFLVISVGGVFLNFLLKMVFQRERPGGEVSHIEVFNFSLEIPSYSFPSGHTMRATILLLFVMYLVRRFLKNSTVKISLYVIISLMIVSVALSRLFLEAHFLSDTLAAISISITWFCLCLLLLKRYDRNNQRLYYPVIGK